MLSLVTVEAGHELPPSADSNVSAFDRAAATLLPFADWEVEDIAARVEAKPFFVDFHQGEARVWRWRPRTGSSPQQQRSVLDYYLEVR